MRPNFILVLLITCETALSLSGCHLGKGSGTQATQREVERTLGIIIPPPGAIRKEHHTIYKSEHGNVVDYYKSDLAHKDIRAYYDKELARHGWVFKKESKLTSWGLDRGEIMAFYCKDRTSAEVYYTGQEASRLGYNFSVGLSWGLYPCP